MTRKSSLLAWTLSAALALSALGCSRAYGNAMERGHALAQAGDWDAAAASYETAVQLKPASDEARLALYKARLKQASKRIAASRAHLARGELVPALVTAHEAISLTPNSREARIAYDEARGRVLSRAEALLAENKADEALELTRAIRRVDPSDQQAANLEGRCLDHIASHGYDQALGYIEHNKLGNALLALREVERTRPGFRDAAARADAIQSKLEDEVRFILVVERAAQADRTSLATRVEESLLRWTPDSRFPLSTATDRAPTPGAQAVRIQPKLGPIAHKHDATKTGQSCEYVCGVDRVANPAYDVASRKAAEAERRMRSADASVISAGRALGHARREVTKTRDASAAASAEVTRTRTERDACLAQKKKASENCQVEEDRHAAAKRASDAAETREQEALSEHARAESAGSEADEEKKNARTDWERSLRELQSTPTTITVDRVCTHHYSVDVHTFSSDVTLALKVHVIGEPAPVELPPSTQTTRSADETFPAESGRCARVAAGDPLETPSDANIEAALAARVVVEIQTHVATWYASYVKSYQNDYETAKAAGQVENANEAFVRWRLVGPGLKRQR